jgi:hypothetical protein
MTQPGKPGSTDTENDGFGPTRLERGAQAVAPKAPPAGAPLFRGRGRGKPASDPSAPPKGSVPNPPKDAPAKAAAGQSAPIAPGAPATRATPANGAPANGVAASAVIADAPTTGVPSIAPKAATAAPKPAKATKAAAARGRGPRRARLQLRNVNAWTVFKFASVLSVFLFLAWLIVVMLLFGVLNASGVIGDINRSVTTINGPGSSGVVNGGRVFAYALIIGAVNAILFIALTTIGSVVYNLCADLVGGVEVTLSERES